MTERKKNLSPLKMDKKVSLWDFKCLLKKKIQNTSLSIQRKIADFWMTYLITLHDLEQGSQTGLGAWSFRSWAVQLFGGERLGKRVVSSAYLQPLPITHSTTWALPPVRSVQDNKCNTLESLRNHHHHPTPPWSVEKLSSTKPVPGAKKRLGTNDL